MLTRLLVPTAIGMALLTGAVFAPRSGYDLRGKTALVTGGSRGFGLILARELLNRGATVAICARDADELARARDQLGGGVVTVPCDLTDPEQIRSLVDEVRSVLGPIDILVNNAGVMQVGPEASMTEADYEHALDLHFWAPLRLVRAVLPEMKARGEGRIVDIVSVGGRVAVPHLLPYVASKYALSGLSRGLRAELASSGVLVTTVYPALMTTGSPPHATVKGDHQGEYRWFYVASSLPVLAISPERAARKVIRAMQRGQPELALGWYTRLLATMDAAFPNLTLRLGSIANRLLPAADGAEDTEGVEGREAATRWTRRLGAATQRASERYNEL